MDTKDMIFVFGSNLRGVHGAGAAAYALRNRGAMRGIGEGMTGHSYALPTKDANIEARPFWAVAASVERFKSFAETHPEMPFQVTRVGCGLAGFQDGEIAPLFDDAPSNCFFDDAWKEYLPYARFWGTF